MKGIGIYIKRRKNDPEGNGLLTRISEAMVHPNVCPVKLIDKYMDVGGLTVSAGCTKSVDSKNRCDACGRLFRATDYGWRLRSTGAANHCMTKTSVATAVSDALARVGVAG